MAETIKLCARMTATSNRNQMPQLLTARRPYAHSSTTALRDALAVKLMALIVLVAALAPGARAVAATVNLAQSDQAVAPAPADARRLATYFSPPYQAGPLPSAVDEVLARSAPAELRAGCAAMVDSWGTAARGTSRVSLRILAVAGGSAWLAYRCDSRMAPFDNDYSERLAVFTAARGTIQFLNLKAIEDTGATLYHVGFAKTLRLRGAENSAAFEVFAVGSSPSAGSASRNAEERLSQNGSASQDRSAADGQAENRFVVIANSATATKPVLALVTARKRPGAPNGDTAGADVSNSDEYRAALRFDHDLTGHLTAVVAYARNNPTGERSSFGVIRYAWNPATFTFAVAKPIPPPSVHRPKGRLPRGQSPPERLPPVPGYHPLAN